MNIPGVEPTIPINDDLTIAISDVHGCLKELKQLVEHCYRLLPNNNLKFIFLGDYVDRGPDSKGVIDYVRQLNAIALLGNHEDMMLEAIGNLSYSSEWRRHYGYITLPSFGVHQPFDTPQEYVTWMKELPYFYNDGLRTFVHAGIQRDRPLTMDEQNCNFMVWARHEFLNDPREEGGFVVHGHTPLMTNKPDLRKNRINIDTGCVFGGRLTAAIFGSKAVQPTHYIQDDGTFVAFG